MSSKIGSVPEMPQTGWHRREKWIECFGCESNTFRKWLRELNIVPTRIGGLIQAEALFAAIAAYESDSQGSEDGRSEDG